MPLRDHFHSPLDDITSWEGFHGGWPMIIVAHLVRKLPRRYVALPRVHSGASLEIDVATYEKDEDGSPALGVGNGNGGVATAVWAPPRPTVTVTSDLPSQDDYEVRVYDKKRGRRLVAAVEIVSPANKDRPEHRRAFVAKCAALLQAQVSVTIIDFVTTRNFNLFGELLELMGQTDQGPVTEPTALYVAACRGTHRDGTWLVEAWVYSLILGRALPTVPLWVADNLAIPLELEESYEETCRILQIP